MRRTSQLLFTLGDEGGPLHRRLYRRMRGLILDGSWPAGTKLPSSRVLAEELRVSRNTALHALELLVADGWATARRGAALHVSSEAPTPLPHLMARPPRAMPQAPIPFEMGRQATDSFPRERWSRLQKEVWAEPGPEMLYGADAGGWPALRRAIANYVASARGLAIDPDQVIVLSSTQAAIDLVTRAVGRPGDRVWVEDPGYPLAYQLFRMNGLSPVAVPVDEKGLMVDQGIARAADARFVYVVPACQFPTGHAMAPERRSALLEWAKSAQAWIIEDDWEWHAWFGDALPPPALRSHAGGGRVIYLQTFNRTIFPGLRIAFLIAPTELVGQLLETHERMNGGPNVPVQATLARFIEDGLYAAHLRVTRAAYEERRAALLAALADLPPGFAPRLGRGGLHIVIGIPDGLDDARLAARARAAGFACMAISEFAQSGRGQAGLLVGFAAFEPAVLTSAARSLIGVLEQAVARTDCS